MRKHGQPVFSSPVGIDCGQNGFDTITTNRSFAIAFKKLSQGEKLVEDQPKLSLPKLLVVDVSPIWLLKACPLILVSASGI